MSKIECWAAVEKNGDEFFYNGKPVWDEKDQEWYLGDKDDKFLQAPAFHNGSPPAKHICRPISTEAR